MTLNQLGFLFPVLVYFHLFPVSIRLPYYIILYSEASNNTNLDYNKFFLSYCDNKNFNYEKRLLKISSLDFSEAIKKIFIFGPNILMKENQNEFFWKSKIIIVKLLN